MTVAMTSTRASLLFATVQRSAAALVIGLAALPAGASTASAQKATSATAEVIPQAPPPLATPPTAQPQPKLKPSTAEGPAKPNVEKRKPAAAVKPDTAQKTASRGTAGTNSGEQSIVALVNDEPITGYEIQQRAIMLSGNSVNAQAQQNFQALIKNPKTTEKLKALLTEVIKANEGKTKDQIIKIFEARKKEFALGMQKQAVESARQSALPAVKKAALEELIDEKLKLQEAKRMSVVIGDDEVGRSIASIAERNKMTEAEFASKVGGSLDAMKNRIRSSLSWNEVVRRQFGTQISITSRDVDKFVALSAAGAEDQVELQLLRIRLAMPAKMDQAVVAQRMQDAETIRAKFKDCKSAGSIATGVAGAKFEELGKRRPAAFPEPTRTLLLNAQDGEMLPPSVGEGGVDIYAEDQKRSMAEGELKQKEFELLSKRRLKDLRTDAHIEYR
jgi:peptidyl-prolyl cis-trans isomerase SurA